MKKKKRRKLKRVADRMSKKFKPPRGKKWFYNEDMVMPVDVKDGMKKLLKLKTLKQRKEFFSALQRR